MKPLTANQALDHYFLEARCRLLDLAAILDRIDRGGELDAAAAERMGKIREALAALSSGGTDRAERVQRIFSLPYGENWPRPQPR